MYVARVQGPVHRLLYNTSPVRRRHGVCSPVQHTPLARALSVMHALRLFLGFFLGAAITAAFVVLLLPPSPSPCPCGGTPPADHKLASSDQTALKRVDTAVNNAAREEDDDEKLAELLRSAAMDDNTIIMTFTNEAWTAPGSLLDVFLESFRIGVRTEPLLKHLVIVAVDGKAFEGCQRVHPLCYRLAAPTPVDFAAEKQYNTPDYLDMMWVRNKFQARVLALGFGFVFTDVDIVWFRNPLLRIPVGADIALNCDWFYGDNPYDLNKTANGGFLHAKPRARTLAFFGDWYAARTRYPGEHDQFVFDQVKHELAARHGVTVQFIDTQYLSGRCEPRMDFRKLCTFHANCIIGLQYKLEYLTGVLDEWKRFKAQEELLGTNSTALTY
ncbi:hypothetical protein ACQJBY_013790 [Aegilops geniculata]